MNLLGSEDPFRLWIRREEGYDNTCTVRFETEHGRAVLGLRQSGREDGEPTSHYEETGIKSEVLRAGRFVHVLPGGQRRSYALSRLAAEVIEQLASSQWIELEPVTEYGFRYLVFPKELPLGEAPRVAAGAPAAPASAAAPAVAAAAPARPAAAAAATPARPAPAATATPARPAAAATPPPRPSSPPGTPSALPPRQTPMAPELAHEALAGLSPQAAIQHLKMEMAKVEALHKRIDELERRLSASQEREQDLLELLQKWQSIV